MNTARSELIIFMYTLVEIETLPEFCQIFESDLPEINNFLTDHEMFIPVLWLNKIFEKMKTTKEREWFNAIHIKLFPKKLKDPVFYTGMGAITSDRPGYKVPRRSPGYKAPPKG